jgi:site-specific recombinase XerD
MFEDMRVRGFSEKTRNDYIRNVRAFAGFIGRSPDMATAKDLRRFQHHRAQTGVRSPSINSAVTALRFFFTVTLDRPDLARRLTVMREPHRLPAVLSVEEVRLLLQAPLRYDFSRLSRNASSPVYPSWAPTLQMIFANGEPLEF